VRDPDGPAEPELRDPLRHAAGTVAVPDLVDEGIDDHQSRPHQPLDEDVDVLLGRGLPLPVVQQHPAAGQGGQHRVVEVRQTVRRVQRQERTDPELDPEELGALRARQRRARGLRAAEVHRRPGLAPHEHDHRRGLGGRGELGRLVTARRPHPPDQRKLAVDLAEEESHRADPLLGSGSDPADARRAGPRTQGRRVRTTVRMLPIGAPAIPPGSTPSRSEQAPEPLCSRSRGAPPRPLRGEAVHG